MSDTFEMVCIDEFADEMTPTDLRGWSDFLTGGDSIYRIEKEPLAKDGDTFSATVQPYRYIAAIRQNDGSYTITPPEEGWTIRAVAYGYELGWSGDMMIGRSEDLFRRLMAEDRDATPEEDREDELHEAQRLLSEMGDEPIEFVVHFGPSRPATIVYRTNPPRCEFAAPKDT